MAVEVVNLRRELYTYRAVAFSVCLLQVRVALELAARAEAQSKAVTGRINWLVETLG